MSRFIMYSERKSFNIMRCKIFEHKEIETSNFNIMTREKLNFQRLINKLK